VTTTTTPPRRRARRKTEQAVKIAATITPNAETAKRIGAAIFGEKSPLFVRGGRLTINAAIGLDLTKPGSAQRAQDRVLELQNELAAIATVHTFTTQAGPVPDGQAEVLPPSGEEG
jgi:hypothetical protein